MGTPAEEAEWARDRIERVNREAGGRSRYQALIREATGAALKAIEASELHRAAELEAVRAEFREEVDRERRRSVATGRELAEEKARGLAAKKDMSKVAELKKDHSRLTFEGPAFPHGGQAPWTVDDMEKALYDIRLCGGDGETELDVPWKWTTRVPYPETVVRSRSRLDELQPAEADSASGLVWKGRRPGIHPLLGAMAVALIAATAWYLAFVVLG